VGESCNDWPFRIVQRVCVDLDRGYVKWLPVGIGEASRHFDAPAVSYPSTPEQSCVRAPSLARAIASSRGARQTDPELCYEPNRKVDGCLSPIRSAVCQADISSLISRPRPELIGSGAETLVIDIPDELSALKSRVEPMPGICAPPPHLDFPCRQSRPTVLDGHGHPQRIAWIGRIECQSGRLGVESKANRIGGREVVRLIASLIF
jgi:hypothetical protein